MEGFFVIVGFNMQPVLKSHIFKLLIILCEFTELKNSQNNNLLASLMIHD